MWIKETACDQQQLIMFTEPKSAAGLAVEMRENEVQTFSSNICERTDILPGVAVTQQLSWLNEQRQSLLRGNLWIRKPSLCNWRQTWSFLLGLVAGSTCDSLTPSPVMKGPNAQSEPQQYINKEFQTIPASPLLWSLQKFTRADRPAGIRLLRLTDAPTWQHQPHLPWQVPTQTVPPQELCHLNPRHHYRQSTKPCVPCTSPAIHGSVQIL